ncbi:MAG: N-acetyltransferase [Rhodothermaceae bacterium TMED105]|nr:MAG: N-acetyltransferase [Rhodothermaceae bacterium TMED105]
MSKNNIRVVSLTSDMCNKLKAQAAVAMNGDGTCSLKAMSMSCFASELCASNRHSMMNLDYLMSHKYKFVAITGDDDTFVGCVSAQSGDDDKTLKVYFPDCKLCTGALTLYNLCVSNSYRGLGIGRKLVESVLNIANRPSSVYLLVSKLNLSESDENRLKVYTDRINRLLGTYGKLEFDVIDECDSCYFLKHR